MAATEAAQGEWARYLDDYTQQLQRRTACSIEAYSSGVSSGALVMLFAMLVGMWVCGRAALDDDAAILMRLFCGVVAVVCASGAFYALRVVGFFVVRYGAYGIDRLRRRE